MDETTENFFRKRRLELPGLRGEVATQREIGDALQMTGAAVGQWENDATLPPIGRAEALATVYRVTRRRIIDEIAKQAERMAAKSKETVQA